MTATQLPLLFDGPPKPIFNNLAYDGGRCEACETNEQRYYLSCYSKSGAHLPNRFVCEECLPEAEAEAKDAGRFEKFDLSEGVPT